MARKPNYRFERQERDRLVAALDQLRAEPRFQLAHSLADGGLLAPQGAGGGAHRAGRCYGMEDLEVIPVESIAFQSDCCFWTIHYSNFAEARPAGPMLSHQ